MVLAMTIVGAPVFPDIVPDIVAGMEGALVGAFNASFDMSFFRAEVAGAAKSHCPKGRSLE